MSVAHAIEEKLADLRATVIPHDIEARVTRNYGETADEKVNELIREIGLAIVIVAALIMFTLGWREALIVVTAVPLTFALTLLINYLGGYSINRVTLFALILALGLVVDDPIVDVENIFRHFGLRKQPPREAVLTAVNEVRPPIIVATLVVMLSFLPMMFITGTIGPYMRPMALIVPVAMFMSMVVAFTVTPWLSYQVLKGVYGKGGHEPVDPRKTFTYRVQGNTHAIPELAARRVGLSASRHSCSQPRALPLLGLCHSRCSVRQQERVPGTRGSSRGTTAETTDAVLKDMADELRKHSEVAEVLSFAGTASPMDFNGMVRHYYLRREPHIGDLRVNLIAKEDRSAQSHAIVLRVRNGLEQLAKKHNARIKIVEVPPGPPVLSTLVAEVYPEPFQTYEQLRADTRHVRELFAKEPGVVDVDDTFEEVRPRYVFRVDKEKASLTGVTTEQIANTLRIGLHGMTPGEGDPKDFRAGSGHLPRELNPLTILLQIPQESRTGLNELLLRLGVKTLRARRPRGNPVFDKLPRSR